MYSKYNRRCEAKGVWHYNQASLSEILDMCHESHHIKRFMHA